MPDRDIVSHFLPAVKFTDGGFRAIMRDMKEMWFIKHPILGYFVGEGMGIAWFEFHVGRGIVRPFEKPIIFPSKEEAKRYLDSWAGLVSLSCFVTDEIPPVFAWRKAG